MCRVMALEARVAPMGRGADVASEHGAIMANISCAPRMAGDGERRGER
jgi:hypothetical protein